MSRPTICIKPQEFNESNLVISEPKTFKPKDSNARIITSEILYQNKEGKLCDLYISLPSIEAYGPFKQYSYNKNKTPENIQGYSISYTNPIVEKMFEIINKVCQDKINEFAELNLIKPSKLKPTFNYRPKSEDQTKIAYFKLNTVRDYETNLTEFLTKITDPVSNEELDPKDTISNMEL